MKVSSGSPDTFVADDRGLADLCDDLRRVGVIGVDTEFMRVSTYFPKICLVQLSSPTYVAIVDALAISDWLPLAQLLEDRDVVKVFHANQQDSDLLAHVARIVPIPIFDSQLAAAFLGYHEQVGYGALVGQLLNVTLPKDATRTDWERRPLQPEQIRYACDDVRYLIPLYDHLHDDLVRAGKWEWMLEESVQLSSPERFLIVPGDAWLSVKGRGQLNLRQAAVLCSLAAWREEQAIINDKPRRWLIDDEMLLWLATVADLSATIVGQRYRQHRHRCPLPPQVITDAWHLAQESASDVPPIPQALERLSPEQEEKAKLLAARLRELAQDIAISSPLLATRREIELWVRGQRAERWEISWRRSILEAVLHDEQFR